MISREQNIDDTDKRGLKEEKNDDEVDRLTGTNKKRFFFIPVGSLTSAQTTFKQTNNKPHTENFMFRSGRELVAIIDQSTQLLNETDSQAKVKPQSVHACFECCCFF